MWRCTRVAFCRERKAVAGPFTLEKDPALAGSKNITKTESTTKSVMMSERDVTLIV